MCVSCILWFPVIGLAAKRVGNGVAVAWFALVAWAPLWAPRPQMYWMLVSIACCTFSAVTQRCCRCCCCCCLPGAANDDHSVCERQPKTNRLLSAALYISFEVPANRLFFAASDALIRPRPRACTEIGPGPGPLGQPVWQVEAKQRWAQKSVRDRERERETERKQLVLALALGKDNLDSWLTVRVPRPLRSLDNGHEKSA